MPSDWELVNFGDVLEFAQLGCVARTRNNINKILLIKMGNLTFGGFNFDKLEYIDKNQIQNSESLLLEEGDFLFNTRNSEDLVGKCAVWRKEFPKAIFDNNILRIRFKKNKIFTADYVSFLFNSHYGRKKLEGFIKRTTSVAAIYYKDLKHFKIPLPPLDEQQKIISFITKVDELIQKLYLITEQSQRLKKGLMQRLLTKGINHNKFEKLKFHSIYLSVPENWKYVRMKMLSHLPDNTILTGPFGSMLHSYDYVKEGTPLILIKNIQNGRINEKGIPRIARKDVERLGKYKVKKGDIVFSRVGRVGSAALIEEMHEGWLISGQTLRIRFDNPDVNPQFINYFIQLDIFQKVLKAGMLGSTRDSINTKVLENSPVLLPTIEEQNEIVKRILNIDYKIENDEKLLLHIQNLKKGLAQQLLTGKIRVRV